MLWSELITSTACEADCSPADAGKVMSAMLKVIAKQMETDDHIQLAQDFGSFGVREVESKAVGVGRQVLVKSKRTPIFKQSSQLKRRLRQSDEDYIHDLRESGRDAQADRIDALRIRREKSNPSDS